MVLRRDATVREIVAADFRAAAVFHRHQIPFCCGGGQTLSEVCGERGLDQAGLLGELQQVLARREPDATRAAAWDASTLVAYVVGHHHAHTRLALPALAAHARKVAVEQGGHRPDLLRVATLTEGLLLDLTSHMAKEEGVVFPSIVALADSGRDGAADTRVASVKGALRLLQAEHAALRAALEDIRHLTGGYAPAADRCPTSRVCLQELEAFDRDLRAHLDLEDDLLFPAARTLAEAAGC